MESAEPKIFRETYSLLCVCVRRRFGELLQPFSAGASGDSPGIVDFRRKSWISRRIWGSRNTDARDLDFAEFKIPYDRRYIDAYIDADCEALNGMMYNET